MKIREFYRDWIFLFSRWGLFNFLNFMKTRLNMTNTSLREAWPGYSKTKFRGQNAEIKLPFDRVFSKIIFRKVSPFWVEHIQNLFIYSGGFNSIRVSVCFLFRCFLVCSGFLSGTYCGRSSQKSQTYLNLKLKAAGLSKYVWPFSRYQVLNG